MRSGKNSKNSNSGTCHQNNFDLLVYAYLGKSLKTESAAELRHYLQDPNYVARFVKICKQDRLIYELYSSGLPQNAQISDSMDFTALHEFAQYETCAPTATPVFTPQKPVQQIELIQKVQREKIKYNPNRTSLVVFLVTAAAAAFLVLLIHLTPPVKNSKVAVLSDSIHAKWADADAKTEKGAAILAGRKSQVLQEGCAKLLFDNNTQVTIEGPAEFEIRTEDQIKLLYGRLYAIVPREGIGFSVYTQNARIIDLGTEFGIQVDKSGDTSLYVMRGKTVLIAGENSNKDSIEVTAGQAKIISGTTSTISDVMFRHELFVRDINSASNTIWKGQNKINLADIVGGGNGLGTGILEAGINPASGMPSRDIRKEQVAPNQYYSVSSNSYIDGVFVPNGKTTQIISSQGHTFQECPVSSGYYYNCVTNAERVLESPVAQDKTIVDFPKIHCLAMHANTGITYDLQAMRDVFTNAKIVRFQSKFGIEKDASRPTASNADFWILVDGELKYQKTQVKWNTFFEVALELSEKDRFLTLVVTEGGDPDGRIVDNLILSKVDSDWGVFADPVLILE